MPIVIVPPPAAPAAAARQATARATVRTEKVRRTGSLLARVDPLRPTRLPARFPGRKAELGPDSHKEAPGRAGSSARDYCKQPERVASCQGPPRGRFAGIPLRRLFLASNNTACSHNGGWNGEQVEDQGERSRAQRDREPGHAAPLRPAQRAAPAWAALRLRSRAVRGVLGALGREGDPELRHS